MPSTTTRGIYYPLAGDRVKDGAVAAKLASDFQTIAETADAAIGAVESSVTSLTAAAVQYKIPVPPGDVSTWVGIALGGYYRVPTQGQVDAIPGRPEGAGPGVVFIAPLGSTASTITWSESGGLGRVWTRSVGVYATGWRPTSSVRRTGVALTLGQGADVRVAENVGHALPLSLGVNIPRWRVHFRNTNDRTNGTLTGELGFTGVSVGKMSRAADGTATGNYQAGTATVIMGPTTSRIDGAELVTPWVENYPLQATTDYVLRFGFTGASGQQVQYLQGGGWAITGGAAAVHSEAPAQSRVQTSPLDVWVEVEVPASTPVWAYFGDSLTVGQSSTLPVYDGWPAKHARAHGALPVYYAHSGTAMSEWTSASARKVVKYVNTLQGIAPADRLYWNMGGNDIFGTGATVQDMRDRLAVAWPIITAVASRNVIYTTILPRHDPGAAGEVVRQEWNHALRTELPFSGLFVQDVASAVTLPAGDQLDQEWSASTVDIHLNTQGYARIAAAATGVAA